MATSSTRNGQHGVGCRAEGASPCGGSRGAGRPFVESCSSAVSRRARSGGLYGNRSVGYSGAAASVRINRTMVLPRRLS